MKLQIKRQTGQVRTEPRTEENSMATFDPTPQQQAIYDHFADGDAGHLVVIARAGTGKTTTAIEAVSLAPESKILMAAFNRTIAQELQARIGRVGVEAKTLHALGFAFVRQNIKDVKVDNAVKFELARAVCPQNAPRALVTLVAKIHTLVRETTPHVTSAADVEDTMFRFDMLPGDRLEQKGWTSDKVSQLALAAVEQAKVLPRVEIDFADMIFLPLVHGWCRAWYQMVVIDEAQDMTAAQLELAQNACKRDGRIMLIGDDRQAIYGFRGADSDSLNRLGRELGAGELGLTITWRCPNKVVALAKQIVPDITAAPGAADGIIREAKIDDIVREAKVTDFVLSRKNAPLAPLCLALLKAGTPAFIRGRDLGATLLALVDKIGAADIEELVSGVGAWHERESAKAIARLDEESAAERCANLTDTRDLLIALTDDCDSVRAFKERCHGLFSNNDVASSVVLSTIHRAKGLETDTVFILEDTFNKNGGREEANLRYVAITRTKHELVFCTGEEAAEV